MRGNMASEDEGKVNRDEMRKRRDKENGREG